MSKKRLSAKLRRLYEDGEISKSELRTLSQASKKGSKRRMTRKQREALSRGRRIACRKLDRTKAKTKGRSKMERQIETIEMENRKILQKVRLKERLKKAKEDRRALRALRSLNKPLLGEKNASFLLG